MLLCVIPLTQLLLLFFVFSLMCTWISTIKFTGTLLNWISFSCPWRFPQSMTSYRGYATTRRYSYLLQLELYELFVEIVQTIAKNMEKYQHQHHLQGTWVHTLLCRWRIFCRNVAWDTLYTPGFHYWNLL